MADDIGQRSASVAPWELPDVGGISGDPYVSTADLAWLQAFLARASPGAVEVDHSQQVVPYVASAPTGNVRSSDNDEVQDLHMSAFYEWQCARTRSAVLAVAVDNLLEELQEKRLEVMDAQSSISSARDNSERLSTAASHVFQQQFRSASKAPHRILSSAE